MTTPYTHRKPQFVVKAANRKRRRITPGVIRTKKFASVGRHASILNFLMEIG